MQRWPIGEMPSDSGCDSDSETDADEPANSFDGPALQLLTSSTDLGKVTLELQGRVLLDYVSA